ncbi:MAG: hydroxyacid dehydrogenase [Deltaproteobacteria bacterium]|nr:hydroxyacid dehydrogenase [Deltaproteobacteria bacterium]
MADGKKILIAEDVTGSGIDRLKQKYQVESDWDLWKKIPQLKDALRDADALLVRNQTKVNADLLAQARLLKIIGRAGAGYDNIDVEAASQVGVVVCYSPEENAVSVAEHVFGLLLALARKIPGADRSVKNGGWERKKYHGFELMGKTLGILGLGKIGFRAALRAKAFGMRLLAHDAYLSSTSLHVTESGATLVAMDQLLAESDFLSVHLPLTLETRGLLNRQSFSKMKPTAFIINTSRGEVLVEKDLALALQQGQLAGAALDVREKEPPAADSPLNGLDNVILTPHTAGLTYEAQEKVVEAIAEDVDRVLSGQPALRFVNFALPKKKEKDTDGRRKNG